MGSRNLTQPDSLPHILKLAMCYTSTQPNPSPSAFSEANLGFPSQRPTDVESQRPLPPPHRPPSHPNGLRVAIPRAHRPVRWGRVGPASVPHPGGHHAWERCGQALVTLESFYENRDLILNLWNNPHSSNRAVSKLHRPHESPPPPNRKTTT